MTLQHKPHVFVTRMQMRREIVVVGGQDGRRTYEDTTDILRKLLQADDLAVVADGATDLQEQLIQRKDIFSRHGLPRAGPHISQYNVLNRHTTVIFVIVIRLLLM